MAGHRPPLREGELRTSAWGGRLLKVGDYELPSEMQARVTTDEAEIVLTFEVMEDLRIVCTNVEVKADEVSRGMLASISIEEIKEATIQDQARKSNGRRATREVIRTVHRARKPVDPAVLRRVAEIMAEHPKEVGERRESMASRKAYAEISAELGVSPRTAQRYVRDAVELGVEPEQGTQRFVFRGEAMTIEEMDAWAEQFRPDRSVNKGEVEGDGKH